MIDSSVPLSNSNLPSLGASSGEGAARCPICKQRITSRVEDPQTATSAARFLQLIHATDPERYHQAADENPVRRNIRRNVKSREAEMDDDCVAQLDGAVYQRWAQQQWV